MPKKKSRKWWIIGFAILAIPYTYARIVLYYDHLPVATCDALRAEDGSDFDWDAVHTDNALKTCLLKLAHNLETPERMADWMISQGFYDASAYSSSENAYVVNGGWSKKINGTLAPFNLGFFVERLSANIIYAYTIQVTYENGQPKRSNAVAQVK